MRVSDERVEMEAEGMCSYIVGIEKELALDLRDARAREAKANDLLSMTMDFILDCDESDVRRRRGPDLLTRIREYLEGNDAGE